MSPVQAGEADVLVLRSDALSFVALLEPVQAFALLDAGRRNATAVDLDARLGLQCAGPRGAERFLVVRSQRGDVVLRTSASLQLERLPAAAFWRLPRLLRRAGCRPWIRGVVYPASGDSSAMALWIDLAAIGLETGALQTVTEPGRPGPSHAAPDAANPDRVEKD